MSSSARSRNDFGPHQSFRKGVNPMTNSTSGEMLSRGRSFLENHRHLYLSSGGKQGHIVDLSAHGGRRFATHLLLRYLGRKTGQVYINPLLYSVVAGEVVIVASKGGADKHPAWYLNLVASDEVQFQIGTQAFRGAWREPERAEREALWNFMLGNHPPFADYQAATSRQIPIVLMRTTEEIPVFSESDVLNRTTD
jgi:deazaflavin-dependent oxidoreductase (nitroreductase family)